MFPSLRVAANCTCVPTGALAGTPVMEYVAVGGRSTWKWASVRLGSLSSALA